MVIASLCIYLVFIYKKRGYIFVPCISSVHYFYADTHNYCIPVTLSDIDDVKIEFTTCPSAAGCSAEMEEVCLNLMAAHNKELPSSVGDGLNLFEWLCSKLE